MTDLQTGLRGSAETWQATPPAPEVPEELLPPRSGSVGSRLRAWRQRRLGAADPAALLEVLERLERDVHPEVGRAVVEDDADVSGVDDRAGRLPVALECHGHGKAEDLGVETD